MDREELVGVLVRLFAVGIVLYVVSRAPTLAILFSQVADLRGLLFSGGLFLILLSLGGLFWFFPGTIARLLLPRRVATATESRWSAEELLCVGLVLVGVYLAFHVVSDAVTWAMLMLFNSRNSVTATLSPAELARVVATAVEAVLALWLIFGARGISSLVWNLRTSGTARPPSPSAE